LRQPSILLYILSVKEFETHQQVVLKCRHIFESGKKLKAFNSLEKLTLVLSKQTEALA